MGIVYQIITDKEKNGHAVFFTNTDSATISLVFCRDMAKELLTTKLVKAIIGLRIATEKATPTKYTLAYLCSECIFLSVFLSV